VHTPSSEFHHGDDFTSYQSDWSLHSSSSGPAPSGAGSEGASEGERLLQLAAELGCVAALRELVALGVDPKRGLPLHAAAAAAHGTGGEFKDPFESPVEL
jgi:hypothetical protein